MYDFEVFDRRSAPYVKRPQLTVQRQGAISINAAARRLIGDPEQVELLFDRTKRAIGVRSATAGPHSYPLRKQGAKGTTFVVSARAFLLHFGIPFDEHRRLEVELVDSTLVAELGPEKESSDQASQEQDVNA